MITVTRLASGEHLDSLAAEWSELVARDPAATPFQGPEWLSPWWHNFGSGELHALAFHCGSRLTGFLSFFVHEWLGRRQVTLLGNGITDYLDLTAEPETAAECARLAFDYLARHQDEWDLCDWQDLPPGSALLASVPAGILGHSVDHALPCTRAELPGNADDYEASLPHGLRRTIRIAQRRLERDTVLRFETLRADPDAATLQNLFRLHSSRWATKGAPGMLHRPEVQQTLMAASQRFSAAGKLRLYTMTCNGELSAIICGIADRGRLWGYITGMDPALSRFSPGSLVLRYAIDEAIGEGLSAWEFLRGDEPYKFLWGARTIPKSRLRVWHASTDIKVNAPTGRESRPLSSVPTPN